MDDLPNTLRRAAERAEVRQAMVPLFSSWVLDMAPRRGFRQSSLIRGKKYTVYRIALKLAFLAWKGLKRYFERLAKHHETLKRNWFGVPALFQKTGSAIVGSVMICGGAQRAWGRPHRTPSLNQFELFDAARSGSQCRLVLDEAGWSWMLVADGGLMGVRFLRRVLLLFLLLQPKRCASEAQVDGNALRNETISKWPSTFGVLLGLAGAFFVNRYESYPSCGSILMGWKNQLHTQCVTVYCWTATLSGWESSAGWQYVAIQERGPQQGTSLDLKNRDTEHHGILELELPTMELVDAHQYRLFHCTHHLCKELI